MFGDPEAGTDGEVKTDGAVDAATVEAGEVGGKDGEDEGVASKKVTVPAAEYFGLVEKSRRLKDIEGEVERNHAERERRTTTDNRTSTVADDQRKALEEERVLLQKLEWAASQGDDYAKANLLAMRRSVAAEERNLYRSEMADIDKADRKEVEEFMAQRGIRSPKVAAELLRGGSKYETLAQENARLKAELEAAKVAKEKDRPKQMATKIAGEGPAPKDKSEDWIEYVTGEEWLKRMRDPKTSTKAKALTRDKKLRIRG